MDYLIRFEDDKALDPLFVGHKFSSLAKAHRLDFAVPEAVAISTDAHRYYVENKEWPPGLFENVLSVATALGLAKGLSIRSSATQEDLEKHSFAGQYRSFLEVVTETDLKEKIQLCWKSVEAETLNSYFRAGKQNDLFGEPPRMGVILQKMIYSTVAGVAFGKNPMSPARDEIVIEAVRGLSEILVSGHVTPYRAFVNESGTIRFDSPHPLSLDAQTPFLTREGWQSVAMLLKMLERKLRFSPLDMEWAFDDRNKLWLMQWRSITTIQAEAISAPPGIWTRKIADDLWADRLTPFLADAMIRNSHRFDFSTILPILGIPDIQSKLTIVNGYLYVNCKGIEQVIAFIPNRFRTEEIRSLFPAEYNIEKIPSPPISKRLSVAGRNLLLLMRQRRANPFFCARLARRDQSQVIAQLDKLERLPADNAVHALRKVFSALDILGQIQENNQWPYFYAVVLTWFCRWLMVDVLNYTYSEFLNAIRGSAKNVSIEIEGRFRKMAQKIKADNQLSRRFLKEPSEQLLVDLPKYFREEMEAFLSEYGCRARHRTLSAKRWIEAPEEVIGILKSLVKAAISQEELLIPAKSSVRWREKGLLKLTGRYLDLREDLRFLLDKTLHQIRQSLLTLGAHVGLDERVLFLTAEELNQLVSRTIPRETFESIILERHRLFSRPFEAATYLIDGRPENEFPITGSIIRGIGTSPGRATGRARIVEDPVSADIRTGDILVAKNTDPGWTPIFSMVRGMVMEEGGLLNHCSIVARELGIPAIVGVRGATKRILDGSRITIDGGGGMIRLEETDQSAGKQPTHR
jgi:pyruvate,water dikinase